MDKIEPNRIYNLDCFELINMIDDRYINSVICSPPYNSSRTGKNERAFKNYENRYDIYLDDKTDEEYLAWSVDLFNAFDRILKPNGCIAYNISYSSENTDLIWKFVAEIIHKTNFTTADCIIWKKDCAIPNNTSPNKLTRICEFVFIFARKTELSTFFMNKSITGVSPAGQNFYENIFNFIEAPNNDGSNPLNKATYSTKLVRWLLKKYSKIGDLVMDPFMGTFSTAIGCIVENRNYIGSELSKAQCEYGEERIKDTISQLGLFDAPIQKNPTVTHTQSELF